MRGLARASLPLKCLDQSLAMETSVKVPGMTSSTGTLHITFNMDDVTLHIDQHNYILLFGLQTTITEMCLLEPAISNMQTVYSIKKGGLN